MAHSPQSEQLHLWDAPESRQEAASEAAAPVRRYGPTPGRPRNKGAWGDLATDDGFDKPARFSRADLRRLYARERFARAIGSDTRQKQSALNRCNFFCNRLIEERFPLAQFSELDYFTYNALDCGHRIEQEEDNE